MFSGYKTYIVAGIAIVTAVGLYFAGEIDLATTSQRVFEALMVVFLRNGIAKA